jgi:hypothetical protein
MFQADLADVHQLARYNHGIRFLLCLIDVFSKRAWVRALRRKTGAQVRDALQSIWTDPVMAPRRPTNSRMKIVLATDAGKEFLNASVQRWLAERNIEHRVLQGDHKAAVVERFQRTLKERLHRLMSAAASRAKRYKYADKLQALLTGYNGSLHRTLGMRPVDVRRGSSERLVHHRQYLINERSQLTRRPRDDLQAGDTVKISESEHQTFRKGYVGYWRDELFRVTSVHQGVPNKQYTIESAADGEPIKGAFYREQLLKVSPEENDQRAKVRT